MKYRELSYLVKIILDLFFFSFFNITYHTLYSVFKDKYRVLEGLNVVINHPCSFPPTFSILLISDKRGRNRNNPSIQSCYSNRNIYN